MIRLVLAIVAAILAGVVAANSESTAIIGDCMKGPIRNINSDACWNFDTDDDGDVDLRDWADWVLYCPDGCEQPAGD